MKRKRKKQKKENQNLREITVRIIHEQKPAVSVPVEETKTNSLILPTNSMLTFNYFMKKHKDLFYVFLLKEIDKAVSENLPVLELFRVGNTALVAKVEKKDYERSILDLQKFFIEKEQYEKADLCKELLHKHKVNQLIDSTTSP